MLIDLSHDVEAGMVTYPGLPAPILTDYLAREASRERYGGLAEFHIGRIEMIANTGTYLDAPFHRFGGGADIGQLPLERMAGLPGMVVTLDRLTASDVRGRAVLIHTGWSRHWRTEKYGDKDHPYVSREAAQFLAGNGAALVGIDSVNIDSMADLSRPAHSILLAAGIPIVEHLTNLAALGDREFTFFAVPPPIRGMGASAVRAFAVVA